MTFQSYSQAGQDRFAWLMTGKKTDGLFVDIGCNHATIHSNTFGLEELGWRGLLIDIVYGCENRKGTFIKCDAANPDVRMDFFYNQLPPVVDYLSLDVDDALTPVFRKIPWHKIFRVVTLEHDVYRKGPQARDEIRATMKDIGYDLICGDVMVEWPLGNPPVPYEDWYVWPQLTDAGLMEKYRCFGKHWKEILGR
jgi:hypothetical protein